MLDIITKLEYFSWLDENLKTKGQPHTLKAVQDSFVLSRLSNYKNAKIAEIGGGQSRVLDILSKDNECWNIDKLEGLGNGPTDYNNNSRVKLVKSYLGEFSNEVPNCYFDAVFSISVVEHVNIQYLLTFFRDTARILKPGGICIHAIDVYLGDFDNIRLNPQIDIYRSIGDLCDIPLEFVETPKIDSSTTFKCCYASNSDMIIYGWNKSVPKIDQIRNNCQSVSIKGIWEKKIRKPEIHSKTGGTNDHINLLSKKLDSYDQTKEIFENNKSFFSNKIIKQFDTFIKTGKRIVLVYQMGKVGSNTFMSMLRSCDDIAPIHVHRLDEQSNNKMITSFLRRGKLDLAFKEYEWKTIAAYIKNNSVDVDIVSAMREPISRNISAFFENLNYDTADSIDALINSFLSNYDHELPMKWFTSEFKNALGIDIFNYNFNKNQGWDYFKIQRTKCLILTVEISDDEKLRAMQSVFGREISEIKRSNIGDKKPYADKYILFKNQIRIPKSMLNIFDNKVVKYFYKDSKRSSFKEKWKNRVRDA